MEKRWQRLAEAAGNFKEICIVLHDDPDPDAIASGEALRFLLREKLEIAAQVAYRGVIGRAENKALVDYLEISLEQLPDEPFPPAGEPQGVALIDTQPGAGNSPLPAGYPAAIVIDHHGERDEEAMLFGDVRPWIGASATMLTQYLRAAELKPTMRLATALFYGIKTDTRGLSRDTSAADVAAYFHLLQYTDIESVVEIENAQVPAAYFQKMANAIHTAQVYDGVVISYLGPSDYPDLAAEVADLFLRLEGVEWVVCMGLYEGNLYLSVRAREEDANAQALAREIIGETGSSGGRNTLAGGQIPLDGRDAEELAEKIRHRALQHLQIPADVSAKPLVP